MYTHIYSVNITNRSEFMHNIECKQNKQLYPTCIYNYNIYKVLCIQTHARSVKSTGMNWNAVISKSNWKQFFTSINILQNVYLENIYLNKWDESDHLIQKRQPVPRRENNQKHPGLGSGATRQGKTGVNPSQKRGV